MEVCIECLGQKLAKQSGPWVTHFTLGLWLEDSAMWRSYGAHTSSMGIGKVKHLQQKLREHSSNRITDNPIKHDIVSHPSPVYLKLKIKKVGWRSTLSVTFMGSDNYYANCTLPKGTNSPFRTAVLYPEYQSNGHIGKPIPLCFLFTLI